MDSKTEVRKLEVQCKCHEVEPECTCGKDDLYGILYYPHTKYCPKADQ